MLHMLSLLLLLPPLVLLSLLLAIPLILLPLSQLPPMLLLLLADPAPSFAALATNNVAPAAPAVASAPVTPTVVLCMCADPSQLACTIGAQWPCVGLCLLGKAGWCTGGTMGNCGSRGAIVGARRRIILCTTKKSFRIALRAVYSKTLTDGANFKRISKILFQLNHEPCEMLRRLFQ